jgi:hypothetical protein
VLDNYKLFEQCKERGEVKGKFEDTKRVIRNVNRRTDNTMSVVKKECKDKQ